MSGHFRLPQKIFCQFLIRNILPIVRPLCDKPTGDDWWRPSANNPTAYSFLPQLSGNGPDGSSEGGWELGAHSLQWYRTALGPLLVSWPGPALWLVGCDAELAASGPCCLVRQWAQPGVIVMSRLCCRGNTHQPPPLASHTETISSCWAQTTGHSESVCREWRHSSPDARTELLSQYFYKMSGIWHKPSGDVCIKI